MSVLDEAASLIHGDRQNAYGHPLDNHGATGELWTVYIERKHGVRIPLDAEDVCWMNVLQKISREAHVPARDNSVDVIGYVGNIELIRDERVARGTPS